MYLVLLHWQIFSGEKICWYSKKYTLIKYTFSESLNIVCNVSSQKNQEFLNQDANV